MVKTFQTDLKKKKKESIHPSISINSKQDIFKQIDTETYCKQNVEKQKQRENLGGNKREVTHHLQEILTKITLNFSSETTEAVGKHKRLKEKKVQKTRIPDSGKLTFTSEDEVKTSKINTSYKKC